MLWPILAVVGTLFAVTVVAVSCVFISDMSQLQSDSVGVAKVIRDDPVDVVITWVDQSDIEWGKRYEQVYESLTDKPHRHNGPSDDLDPLEYTVRLVLKNLSWVRNVIIFTQRPQVPEWVKEYDQKVRVVHHDEVFEGDTFNGMVTTSNTVDIPGLSEHYIQADDDEFILKPLPKSYFFDEEMRPVLYPRYMPAVVVGSSMYDLIKKNTFEMLRERTNMKVLTCNTNHVPVACKQELVRLAKASIPESKWETLSPIRTPDDFDFFGLYLNAFLIWNHRSKVRIRSTDICFVEGGDVTKDFETDATFLCMNNRFTSECVAYLEKRL